MTEKDTAAFLNIQKPIDQETYGKAIFNILEDFSEEKNRLEQTHRVMLNLLEDFHVERSKVESANRELQQSIESLRVAKEATDAANRELEAFSHSASHDLRAPLRSIAGFSQVLLEDYSVNLDEEGRDLLNRVIAAAERMGLLIDDLLKLSRISRIAMERHQVDLSIAARNISDRLRAADPGRQAEFIVAEGLLTVGDGRLITLVLENLLGNAWKFTEKRQKAVIEFGALSQQEELIFFIRDNGAGFDMTYSGKLFQPFQRLHKVEQFPGTGIGLATVKRIIERHGGRVWIEGEVDKGTTVYFSLEPKEPVSHSEISGEAEEGQ
jgi:light-regulated signal transduction histidine kinase (bacteriophytochrome)